MARQLQEEASWRDVMKIKTKLYTKQQIKEAIAFWTKILENTSPLIDSLIEDFGYDVVFGDRKIIPSLKIIEEIYDLVNLHMFSNALSKCPIEIDKYDYCKKDDALMGYNCFMYEEIPCQYRLKYNKEKGRVLNIRYILQTDKLVAEKWAKLSLDEKKQAFHNALDY